MEFRLIILLFLLTSSVYSQSDTLVFEETNNLGIDVNKSYKQKAENVIYIIKSGERIFHLDSIGPNLIKRYEIRRGKFLVKPKKKYKYKNDYPAILIIIKPRFRKEVSSRINNTIRQCPEDYQTK